VSSDDGRQVPAGVDVAERTNPEAIVDAAMPGIDGVETLRRLLIAVPHAHRGPRWSQSLPTGRASLRDGVT
jgi:hypothetical protein